MTAAAVPLFHLQETACDAGFDDNFFACKDAIVMAVKECHKLDSSTHYSQLPVQAIKQDIAKFRPVHRCKLDVLRKILDSGGCLQSKYVRDSIPVDLEKALHDQLRHDLRLRAWMLKWLHKEEGAYYIYNWVCALGSLALAEQQQKPESELAQKRASEEEAFQTMLRQHGWSDSLLERIKSALRGGAAAAAAPVLNVMSRAVSAAGSAVATGFVPPGHIVPIAVAVGIVLSLGLTLFMLLASTTGGQTMHMQSQEWDRPSANLEERIRQEMASLNLDSEQLRQLRLSDQQLQQFVDEAIDFLTMFDKLKGAVKAHAENIVSLHPTGIGCPVDKKLGTNRQSFSVVGPHFAHYYGEDAVLILKQTLMYEPDFDMTPCAGTSFHSGRAIEFQGTPVHTWLNCGPFRQGFWNRNRVQQFHMAKLNAGVWGWRSAMAATLATSIANQSKGQRKWDQLEREHVLDFYRDSDSHCLIEGHLPGRVQLGPYLERMVVKEEAWRELSDEQQERLTELAGDRLSLVSDTLLPAVVMKHCLEGLETEEEKGFRVVGMPMTYRRLRGVRPRSPETAKVSLHWKGTFQLLLASKTSPGKGLVLGFGGKVLVPPTTVVGQQLIVGHEGVVELSPAGKEREEELVALHIATEDNQDSKSRDVWILTSDGSYLRLADLGINADDWSHCQVEVTSKKIVVDDLEKNKRASLDIAIPGTFSIESVWFKTGLAEAAFKDLKIL